MTYKQEHHVAKRKLMDISTSIGPKVSTEYELDTLPVIIQVDGRVYCGTINVRRSGNSLNLLAEMTELLKKPTPMQLVDDFLEATPGVPLICDEETAQELARYSLSFQVDGMRHRLLARPKGFLEVYSR